MDSILGLFGGIYSGVEGIRIWCIVSLILAIIGAIVGYILFVKPDKKQKNKIVEWIKDFFAFNNMLIEDLLKILYAFMAIYITLSSFALLDIGFENFIEFLIIGNISARITFEILLVIVGIWRNTTDINKKLKK